MLAAIIERLINLLGWASLATTLWMIGQRSLLRQVAMLRWQAYCLGGLALLVAAVQLELAPLGVALELFALRGLLIPAAWQRVLQPSGPALDQRAAPPPPLTLALALALFVVAYVAFSPLTKVATPALAAPLPLAGALVLIGVLLLLVWPQPAQRIAALLVLANGCVLFALLLAPGMLLIIAITLIFDAALALLLAATTPEEQPQAG